MKKRKKKDGDSTKIKTLKLNKIGNKLRDKRSNPQPNRTSRKIGKP